MSRLLRRSTAWSVILALAAQLLLVAATAAVTGGADWPVR